jgi:DNA invertase Pin-like site-specific DNA recombinase
MRNGIAMNRKRKNKEAAQTVSMQAVTYARVSSKEQEKEGFSIPAQHKQLLSYAQAKGFQIAKEYVDVETAKHTGRTNFSEMVQYLKKRANIRIILVEKTDRLYRNLKDWVTLDELDIEIHLIKEGIVLSRDSKSSEKFVHGIKVLMAKNYIDNLSEEAKKGMLEKAEQGIWPSKAPLGYRNVTGPEGKKIIEPDPRFAGTITHQMSETWQEEQDKLMREIVRHQAADRSYLEEGARLIDLAHGSQRLFAKQDAREQRRVLNFVLSNSTWKNGELNVSYRQPFDLIAEATAIAASAESGGALNSPGHPVWLGN